MKASAAASSSPLSSVTDFIHDFLYIAGENGAAPVARFDLHETIAALVILTLLLASAFWAASIASARRHNAILSFVLGLVLPVAYPLVILFTMDIPGKWDFAAEEEKASKGQQPQEAAPDDSEATPGNVGELPFEPTPDYFSKIARDDEGKPAGPWECVFAGNRITVLQILDVLPNCISVEFRDARPEARKMRILYEKIETFTPIADGDGGAEAKA